MEISEQVDRSRSANWGHIIAAQYSKYHKYTYEQIRDTGLLLGSPCFLTATCSPDKVVNALQANNRMQASRSQYDRSSD
jgi:hypothetical protein